MASGLDHSARSYLLFYTAVKNGPVFLHLSIQPITVQYEANSICIFYTDLSVQRTCQYTHHTVSYHQIPKVLSAYTVVDFDLISLLVRYAASNGIS